MSRVHFNDRCESVDEDNVDSIEFRVDRIKDINEFREGLQVTLEQARPFLEDGEVERVLRNFNRSVSMHLIEDYVDKNTMTHQQLRAWKAAETKRKAAELKASKTPVAKGKARAVAVQSNL